MPVIFTANLAQSHPACTCSDFGKFPPRVPDFLATSHAFSEAWRLRPSFTKTSREQARVYVLLGKRRARELARITSIRGRAWLPIRRIHTRLLIGDSRSCVRVCLSLSLSLALVHCNVYMSLMALSLFLSLLVSLLLYNCGRRSWVICHVRGKRCVMFGYI